MQHLPKRLLAWWHNVWIDGRGGVVGDILGGFGAGNILKTSCESFVLYRGLYY